MSQGWLLDGFPRTQPQAQALLDAGTKADAFILLDVPDEVLVDRVVGRRTDPEVGNPPPCLPCLPSWPVSPSIYVYLCVCYINPFRR